MVRGRDIDKILRHLAARDRATGLDSGERWARLHEMGRKAQLARVRARQRTLVLATSLGVLLVGLGAWRNVGTEDFTLVSAKPGPRGERVFASRHRPYAFGVTSDTTRDDSSARLGEELLSRTEGGEGRLTRVFGATINGKTLLMATGVVQTSAGPQVTSLDCTIPVNDPPTEETMAALGRFFAARLQETRHAIESGQAHALAPVDMVVAGRPIRCKRWQFHYPEFGLVVYWEGLPPP